MFYSINFLDPRDNFYIMTIILLAIFIAWFVVFTKEASAPPVVIDNTLTRKEQKTNLLTSSDGNSNSPINNSSGLVTAQFPQTGSYGKSGLAFSGLGQPCISEETNNTPPNLPFSYTTQTCDKSKGLECITGIYEGLNNDGGGICLKIVNETCQIKSDCSPDASFCLNNLCQTKEEVINKSCNTDSDCKGVLGDFNHVCDPNSKRCVYNTWPNDSGCTTKNQCLYYSAFPEAVSCITSDPYNQKSYLVGLNGVYQGSSIILDSESITTLNSLGPANLIKNYTEVYNIPTDLSVGRVLIKNISTENNITLDSNFIGSQGVSYRLEFGTDRDGICLVNFPLGTPPSNIEGTTEKYGCIEGLQQITVDGEVYCIENKEVRKSRIGSLEQVCTSDPKKLTCESGLCCTYDNSMINNFGTLIDKFHVIGTSINGQNIKDIGKCKVQEMNKYQPCNDNCIKPYFCLQESDINNNKFSYCANDWKIMENVSNLTGCPDPYFKFSGTNDSFCKNKNNTFCFSDGDCTNNNICGTNKSSTKFYVNNLYDPKLGWIRQDNNHFSIEDSKNPKILTSNQYIGTSTPSFLSYFIKNSPTSWSFVYTLTGKLASDNNTLNINFDTAPYKDPNFSVFKKSDGTHQLNVEFIEEYDNNRERIFNNAQGDNFKFSGLTHGTSVIFQDTPGVYNISFDSSCVTKSGDDIFITKIKDQNQNNVDNPYLPMTTYSNKFGCNFNSQILKFENNRSQIKNGDQFTYVSGNGSNNTVEYYNNSFVYTELSEGTCYYSYSIGVGEISNNSIGSIIYLTEDFNYCNFNSKISNTVLNNFSLFSSATPSFSNNEGENSYLLLQKLFGYRFLPVSIPTNGENKTITINPREDYISSQTPSGPENFNKPIGYFSDCENIKTDIGVSSLLLTYDYGNNINQVLNLSYSVGENEKNYTNVSQIGVDSGSCYIYYEINNSFSLPNLKVISDNYETSYPYDLDEVRYFENNNSSINHDTVNFLSTYKNISPTDNRSSISNISSLRKLNFATKLFNQGTEHDYEFDVQYQGLYTPIDSIKPSANVPSMPFGSSFYVNLSQIKKSLLITEGSDNIFLAGSDTILFRNQDDIDVILKYGASDLVIGYNGISNAIAIVNIQKYTVDNNGIQALEVKTSTLLDVTDLLDTSTQPILYINNIYPIAVEGDTINDGRILISSCVPQEELTNYNYQVSKTSYNKILTLANNGGNSITTYSYFDFYVFKPNTGFIHATSQPIIFLTNGPTLESIINQFNQGSNNYSMGITQPSQTTSLPDNYVYICNNKFLSLTSISTSSLIYLNNQAYYSDYSVVGKYYSTSKNKNLTKITGNIRFKNNTFPFYTKMNGDFGLLDESYLKQISWPYWIKNLNTGTVNINKIFINWNPGNMENNMFYYCFVTINNVKMLLYLSTNFTVNDIKESESVPIIIDSFDTISENLKMLPYNKNIIILSKFCVAS